MNRRDLLSKVWLGIVAAFLIIPLCTVVVYSFFEHWLTILPTGFTLRFYAEKLKDVVFWAGMVRGIIISIAPVVAINIIMLSAMFAVTVYFPKWEDYIHLICMIPTTINGIILATSALSAYAGKSAILGNRIFMLLCIYSVFCLPVTYQGIRNSLYAVNTKGLLEAASILGAGKFYAYVRVIVPSILSGIVNSSLMCFAGLFGDFAMIKLVASSQYETVQTYLYKNRNTDIQSFSTGVAVILVISLIINYWMHRVTNLKTSEK